MTDKDKPDKDVEIIALPNALKRKVFIDAKGIDMAALEKAHQALLNMASSYLVYAERELTKINECFGAIQQDPRWANPSVEIMYASAHELKGQGGTFGYKMLSEVASRMLVFIDMSKKRKLVKALDIQILQLLIQALELSVTRDPERDVEEEVNSLIFGFEQLFDKATKATDDD